MKIDNIKKMKSGKYKLTFDNLEKMITYDDVILNNGLLFSREIDPEILTKLYSDTYYYDIYNKLIKYITIRMRSQKEIDDYLVKFSLEDKIKDQIIDNLKKYNLINDKMFTRAYINDKIYLSNAGPDKIVQELLEHNIDIDIINEEINKIDFNIIEEKLTKLISKKINSNHKYSNYILKQKILNELINLGYQNNMIMEIYDDLTKNQNGNDILDKEYEKLYKKLSNKFDGYELSMKIKQKLYQKGFDINEINHLIDEKLNN